MDTGEEGGSGRLILDLMLNARLASSLSFTVTSGFLLLWSKAAGVVVTGVAAAGPAAAPGLCEVAVSVFCGGTASSGVFSSVLSLGVLRCRERPIDSNLEVRSAESGRLPAQRGAGTGGSVLAGQSRKRADTGLGLEGLGLGLSGTGASGLASFFSSSSFTASDRKPMDLALVMEGPPLPDVSRSFASLLVVPDHSAAGSFSRLWERERLAGFSLSAGLLGSPGSKGGAALNGWTTGLVVCPAINLFEVLKEVEAGGLELADTGFGVETGCCGFGVHEGSGLCPGRRVDSGRGLVWGLGATMGLKVVLLSTAKGLGVSLGLGPGTGLLGSGVMTRDWPTEGISLRLLLESARGVR